MIIRLLRKLIFHFCKFLLKPLDGRFPRTYMKIYNSLLKMIGVKMNGNPRYISSLVRFDDFNKIHLSKRVVVSEKVILQTHDYSLTTGLITLGNTPKKDIPFIKEFKIGKNVFIGMVAIIMPGTVINDNVIIDAGSVVRGVVELDSIVIGNPEKTIGKLTEKAIKWGSQINYSFIQTDRK